MKVTCGYIDGSTVTYNLPGTKEQMITAMQDEKALLMGNANAGRWGSDEFIIINVKYIMWMRLG